MQQFPYLTFLGDEEEGQLSVTLHNGFLGVEIRRVRVSVRVRARVRVRVRVKG